MKGPGLLKREAWRCNSNNKRYGSFARTSVASKCLLDGKPVRPAAGTAGCPSPSSTPRARAVLPPFSLDDRPTSRT